MFLVPQDFDSWTNRHKIEYLSRQRQEHERPDAAADRKKDDTLRGTYHRQSRRKNELAIRIQDLRHEIAGLQVQDNVLILIASCIWCKSMSYPFTG